jgi:nucleoside-diphosphate-sugar epimerase
MKALVIGATGFLGGALTKALIERGHEVRVMVRMTSKLDSLEGLPVDIRYGCLESTSGLDNVMDEVEIIYNCAAATSDWGRWQAFYDANVLGVKNLLEAAQHDRALKRFVHISSAGVYGYPGRPCDESHPIKEISLPFNRSKVQGERILWDYVRQGLPITILRPVNIFGPRSANVVEWANQLIHNEVMWIDGGKSTAGLMYIDNAVESIIGASLSPATVGQAYNLRDESNENWREFGVTLASGLSTPVPSLNLPNQLVIVIATVFEIFYRLLQTENRPIVTRQQVYLFSRDQDYPIDKAQKDFGFHSQVSFSEGMQRTVKWLKSEEGKAFLVER